MNCDAATSLVGEKDMKCDPITLMFEKRRHRKREPLDLESMQKATVSKSSAYWASLVCSEFIIDQVGAVLQFLGLAEDSDDGWVPTCCLMSIIAEQPVRRSRQGGKVEITKDDRDFLASVYYLATGMDISDDDDDDDGDDEENDTPAGDGEDAYDEEYENYHYDPRDWCWNVLAAWGLLERGEGKDGGFKPTSRMKDLVLKHLLERAVPEKNEADAETDYE